jgi:hypothetical protein
MKRICLMLILLLAATLTANAQWTFVDVTRQMMREAEGAHALAWGDVDNNGYPDLFVGCSDWLGSHLYLCYPEGWIEATDVYEVGDIGRITSAQFIDYDNDNRLDLLCLSNVITNSVQLYRQLPNQRMQRVPIVADFNPAYPATSAVWYDINNDGSLELLLNCGNGRNPELTVLERSEQSFIEVRGEGLPHDLAAGVISMADYDRDSDADLFVGMHGTNPSRLFENIEGAYREQTTLMNIPHKMIDKGVTWADFDHDGNEDFFAFGAQDYTGLYYGVHDQDQRKFANRIDEFGLLELAGDAVDARAVDANNDGWTDLMIVREDANFTYILVNEQGTGWSGGWTTPPQILPPSSNYACAWADFDLDGDMDYALSCGELGVQLFENRPEIGHEWVEIFFRDGTNSPLLNCSVDIEFEHSKHWASTSQSHSGVGFNSSQVLAVSRSELKSNVVNLYITWPNGMHSTYAVYPREINTIITLNQPHETNHVMEDIVSFQSPVELGNHPNPFNPSTTIQFTVPAAGMTKLAVYNLLGQQVALLANEVMDAGTHSLVWDASMLPSGLYFAHLEAAGQTKLSRMLLTK